MSPEWKKRLLVACALLGAFATGRYTVPTKVVDHTTTVKVEDKSKVTALTAQLAQYSTQLDTLRTENDALHQQILKMKLDRHVVRHRITYKDGTIDETQTTDTHVDTTSTTTDQNHTDSQEQHQGATSTTGTTQQTTSETSHSTSATDTTHEVTTEKPQWLISGGIGFNVGSISFKNGFTAGPLVYSGSVEHRLFGPLFAGPQVIYNQGLVIGLQGTLEF